MITKVLPVTLQRRPDKMFAVIGGLLASGVPKTTIEVQRAKDGNDFENMWEVFDAAIADGFEGFKHLKEDYYKRSKNNDWGGITEKTNGHFCCTWSLLRAYRRVIELRQICLVILDEFSLVKRFDVLNDIISEVRDPFLIQLAHNEATKIYPRVPWYPGKEVYPGLMKGFAGNGDSVMVVSPAGAQQIIDWFNERWWWVAIEVLLWDVAREGPHDGCYAAIDGIEKRTWVDFSLELEHFTGKTDSERTSR